MLSLRKWLILSSAILVIRGASRMPPGGIGKRIGSRIALECLSHAKRRKNVHFALEVLYAPGFGRKPRERFEPCTALRASPEMANDLTIQVLRAFRCNQLVAALDATYPE